MDEALVESLVGGLEITEGTPLRKCETLVPSLSLSLPDSQLCLLLEVQTMVLPCLGLETQKLRAKTNPFYSLTLVSVISL